MAYFKNVYCLKNHIKNPGVNHSSRAYGIDVSLHQHRSVKRRIEKLSNAPATLHAREICIRQQQHRIVFSNNTLFLIFLASIIIHSNSVSSELLTLYHYLPTMSIGFYKFLKKFFKLSSALNPSAFYYRRNHALSDHIPPRPTGFGRYPFSDNHSPYSLYRQLPTSCPP